MYEEKYIEISKITSILESGEVTDNYEWLLNPTCNNREFSAGYQSAIEHIKEKIFKIKINKAF